MNTLNVFMILPNASRIHWYSKVISSALLSATVDGMVIGLTGTGVEANLQEYEVVYRLVLRVQLFL